jgi:shugoshin-like protein
VKPASETKARVPEKKTQVPEQNAEPAQETIADEISSLPPKTPFVLMEGIFSPESQGSSAQRPTGQDTPPPSDLANGTIENTGRPGRRARSAINYAEPSLVSKMRRPTKELLNAVGKDGRVLQGSIVSKQSVEKPTTQWKPAFSASAGDGGGDEASSPLRNRTSATISEAGSESKGTEVATVQAKSNIVIGENSSRDEKDIRQADLAIFDFTESSPNDVNQRRSSIGGDRGRGQKGIGRRRSMMV